MLDTLFRSPASDAPNLRWRASGAVGLLITSIFIAFGVTTAAAQEPREPGERPRLLAGLAGDFDADQNGVISREEFDRGTDTLFTELDQNGDGDLSEDELPRFRGPRRGHGPGMGRGPGRGHIAGRIVARAADGDRDGEVTNDEWQAFLGSLDIEAEGAISEDSLRAAMPGPPRMKGAPAEGHEPHPAGPRHAGPRPGHLSRVLDADGDSVLTVDDLNAVFTELDQDDDGNLQAEELPRFRGHRGPPTR